MIENRQPPLIVAAVDAKTVNKLSFEDALMRLETIVDTMESGDVPLAELIARFEEGNKLLQVCETRLKDAEMKIELLKKQNGAAAFASFAPRKAKPEPRPRSQACSMSTSIPASQPPAPPRLLDGIGSPEDLKALPAAVLPQLA
ncbi:MAG TPA: exodeoxyribonuclease VII small subunit, partial [Opitutaceae bacterium]|nr:exodeoxyribonuclease VII small subunit [Opitutaceae bacterium]